MCFVIYKSGAYDCHASHASADKKTAIMAASLGLVTADYTMREHSHADFKKVRDALGDYKKDVEFKGDGSIDISTITSSKAVTDDAVLKRPDDPAYAAEYSAGEIAEFNAHKDDVVDPDVAPAWTFTFALLYDSVEMPATKTLDETIAAPASVTMDAQIAAEA